MSADGPNPSAHDELEAWSLLALGHDPVEPGAELRTRLMAAVTGPARYHPFLRSLQSHFDLDAEQAAALLARVDDAAQWTPGVGAILGFLHFQPGARVAQEAHCGLIRMRGGLRVPLHRHRGREVTIVMEGALLGDDGTRHGPGSVIDMPPGSEHRVRVSKEGSALVALLAAPIDVLGP